MRLNELLRAGFSFGRSSLGELRAAPILPLCSASVLCLCSTARRSAVALQSSTQRCNAGARDAEMQP